MCDVPVTVVLDCSELTEMVSNKGKKNQKKGLQSKPKSAQTQKGSGRKKQVSSRSVIPSGPRLDPRYIKMLNDPCDAALVPGIFGSSGGLLGRFRSVVDNLGFVGGANTYGYIVWFPEYHNGGPSANSHFNLFSFSDSTGTTQPTIAGFGWGATSTTTLAIKDPCYDFVNGSLCQDARTISACMVATYGGTTSNTKGFIMPLTNVPITMFLGESDGTPPTVSQLSAYANTESRVSGQMMVKHRPNAVSKFKKQNMGCFQLGATNTSNTVMSGYTEQDPPMGIGFVFMNITALSDIRVSLYKNIEWRPESNAGMVQQAPRGTDNPSLLTNVLQYLDAVPGDWQVQDMARTAGAFVGEAIRGYALQGYDRPVNPRARTSPAITYPGYGYP